ncbi:hypothetical protein PUR71_12495 [Streptomyces sp. SP17BM10]|uniref:hypothetical protein n=1 Tax=Streptomyces sp. SP17BM10 TaxID=3002530 RepID=UPI002E77DCC4|nr:hypothetical protein [Streptomyces sp. SP17BM10]MEE1783720.1 hypothetical protein [Streptomyces sp. SP17BM10]
MTTQAASTVPRPRADRRPAPWVRTRLRSAPLAALLMAALAFGTVLLAAAFPRAVDRGADGALRRFLHDRGLSNTRLQATSVLVRDDTAAGLDPVMRQLTDRIGRDVPLTSTGAVHGATVRGRELRNPGLVHLTEANPGLDLMYLHDVAAHATLTDGTWPGPATPGQPLPIAISRTGAETIGIKLGDVLDNGEEISGPVRTKVVGLYRADDEDDPYWDDLACPTRACAPGGAWTTGGVVDGTSLAALLAWGGNAKEARAFWRLPVDTGVVRADRLGELRTAVSGYITGRGATDLAAATRSDLRVNSALPDVLDRATARYEAAAPIAAIGPAGVAGVATVVLCLAAALVTERRTAELRLLQARGGSRGGVLLRLLGEGAVTVLPAAVLATTLALVLLPTPRWGAAVLAAGAATLFALLAFPARAALLWARPKARGGRRRVIGELLVLLLTGAAVAEVRRRGVAPVGTGVDPLLIAAPLLLALSGGVLLARVQPVVVGWLAGAAGRGRGLVGFLGLARAARDTSGRRRPSVLPLLALLIAVTTAGFGATVLGDVDGVRLRAARLTVGGDASLTLPVGPTLPEDFTRAAAALPGVRAGTGVWTDTETFLMGTKDGSAQVTLVVAEPTAYAEIARTLRSGTFDPAVLAGAPGGPDTPVPALFSSALGPKVAGGPVRLRLPSGGELLLTDAGGVDATPAIPGSFKPFVVVPVGPAAARLPELARVNAWFGVGDIDDGQFAALVRDKGVTAATGLVKVIREAAGAAGHDPHALPGGYTVHTSAEVGARLAADPLQRSAQRLFWAAVAAAAGFALLAVLLTLLRAAPERGAMLARLRTLGLRPRQGLALILAEAVPQTLAAALGGALVALAAVGLLGPAFDLSALVGAHVGEKLTPALLPVLLPTAGLTLVVCAGVVAETLVSGRRQLAAELRAGDQR